MDYFPVYLNLQGHKCLVVGAGQVGKRKISRLIQCQPAKIVIIDPCLSKKEANELTAYPQIEIHNRPFQPEDLKEVFLVIAGTSDQKTNAWISDLCKEQNILCNVVDQPNLCSFIVPALYSQGDLQIAISTQGTSPALAKQIRKKMATCFGPEYAILASLLSKLRPLILKENLGDSEKRTIFHSLTEDQVLETIKKHDFNGLKQILSKNLPDNLNSYLDDILNELFKSF